VGACGSRRCGRLLPTEYLADAIDLNADSSTPATKDLRGARSHEIDLTLRYRTAS